jgi:serine/threonine-protein kinase HipA
MPPAEAEVRLHGRRVGALLYDKGGSVFRYEDDLLAPDHRTLGQTFEDDPRTVRRARIGLPPWFANVLPEGELRRQVVREMGGGRVGDFRLLLRLGSDLPGAVTVHGTEPDDAGDPTADDIVPETGDQPLRYSLAGVQLKYSVHASRLTVPVSGAEGWWIVKLPDPTLQQLAENEYLTMCWLRAAGIDVPDVECVPAKAVPNIPAGFVAADELLYLVRRFDRAADGRIHVEDFAQVSDVEPRYKYGEFGATYDTMGTTIAYLLGDSGFRAYVARLVAMIVTGNVDAHLKNWALWYPDGRTAALAPVYDFHSLTVYRRFRYAPLALSIAGEQMPNHVTVEHFRLLADACRSDPAVAVDVVAQTVDALRVAWSAEVATEARRRFPVLADHYEQRLATLPIVRV